MRTWNWMLTSPSNGTNLCFSSPEATVRETISEMKGVEVKHLHIKTDYKEWMKVREKKTEETETLIREHSDKEHSKRLLNIYFCKYLYTDEDIRRRINELLNTINQLKYFKDNSHLYINSSTRLSPPPMTIK